MRIDRDASAGLLATPDEVAASLRVSRSKVYELMRTGELQSVKIGGSRRVTWDALRDFVHRLEVA